MTVHNWKLTTELADKSWWELTTTQNRRFPRLSRHGVWPGVLEPAADWPALPGHHLLPAPVWLSGTGARHPGISFEESYVLKSQKISLKVWWFLLKLVRPSSRHEKKLFFKQISTCRIGFCRPNSGEYMVLYSTVVKQCFGLSQPLYPLNVELNNVISVLSLIGSGLWVRNRFAPGSGSAFPKNSEGTSA